ncbi:hypothetical protein [Paenibacillus piscarius]|uniref:hypothetical protein n=1 Tax=Paenibacillus piscarius TaxID=1089681 RepID=UPI001EE957E9|nr:hypothetical protein [Paenibacillus piscarius]
MDLRQRVRVEQRLESVIRRLDGYYAAEEAILGGAQEYSLGSRSLKRGDLNAIREQITELEDRKDELENALAQGSDKRKSYRVVYRDL